MSESFHGDAPAPAPPDDAVQPTEGRPKPHAVSDKTTLPPEILTHRWGHKALREALLFLLVAAVVLVICGLILPIPKDVFWLLVVIVAGTGAAIGAAFYLLNVVPRLLIALIVRRYSNIPWARRLKREQVAFGRGVMFMVLLGLIGGGIARSMGHTEHAVMIPVVALFLCWTGGLFWYSVVYAWNHYINVILRRYSLSPPNDLPPEEEDDDVKITAPPDSDPELEPPLFADTDIISSRAPAQRNAAPTDIQPGEPSP